MSLHNIISDPEISQFPITQSLSDIVQTLKNSQSRTCILTALTGAGKSTILPLALLSEFEGKILMTQPRRIAAIGIAERTADLCKEETGKTCGYKIHLENKTSRDTRLFVVTQAVLLRELADDPFLSDYNVIVIDEFHERSVTIDTALVLLKEALAARDDLYLIIMSATIDANPLSEYLDGCPVIEVPGRTFPVETFYAPEKSVVQAVTDELNNIDGTILVFLPGIAEIKKNYSLLQDCLKEKISDGEIELCILHSSITIAQQKTILYPTQNKKTRIILSSAIAETSLTVPDVKVVIDSGLCRLNTIDLKSGMQRLVTVKESQFNAAQRQGRAGRTQSGRCIRLWPKTDILAKHTEPEISRVELFQTVLEFANQGITDLTKINFLTCPPSGAWNEAIDFLKRSKLLAQDNSITQKGKSVLSLGIDIRPGTMCLAAYACNNNELLDYVLDLYIQYSNYADSPSSIQEKAKQDIRKRLQGTGFTQDLQYDKSTILLEGFSDRLAMRITAPGEKECIYQFVSGRKAVIADSAADKNRPLWICAPDVMSRTDTAIIFSFETMSGPSFDQWVDSNTKEEIKAFFEGSRISKNKTFYLGRIPLKTIKLTADKDDLAQAWLTEIENKGFDCLPSDNKTQSFLTRAEFLKAQTEGYPENCNKKQNLKTFLEQNASQWLVPFLSGKQNLDAQTVYAGLYWFLDGASVDSKVPETLTLENGRKVKVSYQKTDRIVPVIEVIIQRIFGCKTTPQILGQKVLLKLLSPASRPLQITQDLEGFWNGAWQEICTEMKGRYPKHNWNKDIMSEE